ncbi:MAG: hypothetical protein CL693_14310 [Cellvibrionaceae bacterium]|nr:hypothetical protein [Cellvibrionaceae bacterium]|tara:strand:+ start:24438 stop:25667 length:1230 start_codon:yes stop_codon:yes gene_type:complete
MITAEPIANHEGSLSLLAQAVAILLVSAVIVGCTPKEQSTEPKHSSTELITVPAEALQKATSNSWYQAAQSTTGAEERLLILQTAVQQLLQTPSDATLAEARIQWQQSHDALLQLQPLFTLGNINPGLFQQLQQSHWQLDAWPIEPGYLDYFDVYTHSGIVNDIALPINAQAIRQQHGFSSDADVALGMHAMAYLLWGEDQQRPASDFLSRPANASERKNGLEASDLPAQRRSALLSLQTALLQDDLKSLSYRLHHNASGINVSYFSLPPQSQLQLWQGVLEDILTRQIQTELTAQLKSLKEKSGQNTKLSQEPTSQTHQQFADRPLSTISTLVSAIEPLVMPNAGQASHESLAYWLNPELDLQQLQLQFKQISDSVTAWQNTSEPTLEQAEQLDQQLQALTLALIPAR